jgi:hypothetical protein
MNWRAEAMVAGCRVSLQKRIYWMIAPGIAAIGGVQTELLEHRWPLRKPNRGRTRLA